MATSTTRLLVVKPAEPESADINVINANMDKIDKNFIPSAKIRSIANQTIPNATTTKLLMGITDWDSFAGRPEGDMADLTNDRIYCRISGLYTVRCALNWPFTPTGYRALDLRHGATQLKVVTKDPNTGSSADTSIELAHPIKMTAGQYVEMWGFHSAGGSISALNAGSGIDTCYIQLEWVGSDVP